MMITSLFLGSVGQHSFAASGKRSAQYNSKYCGFESSASTDASGSSHQPSHTLVEALAQWQVQRDKMYWTSLMVNCEVSSTVSR